jgi:hypothetical protein
MSVGVILVVLGIIVETVGIVPPVKAVLRIPLPLKISGTVGAVMIVLGAIFWGMGI